MNYTVTLTDRAIADLDEIYDYIANSLGAVTTAYSQISRIEKALRSLETMPERFQLYLKEPWLSRGLRTVIIDNYIAFYFTDQVLKTVTVIRILYGKRDLETELGTTEQ